ncbi:MAG: hypothetical protein B6U95_09695 [Thermofilum sp. ex4484_82]|nr:MAG: hypothetical protein B6U95_09695 [Thermofilum sp. ex4484_82]OYT35703.1 MAG: hypothetical protein B6U96_09705 [Archaeoglobales archaeon ex4484_92]
MRITEKLLNINYREVITVLGEDVAKSLKQWENKIYNAISKAERSEDVLRVVNDLYQNEFKPMIDKWESEVLEENLKKIKNYKKKITPSLTSLYSQLKDYKKKIEEIDETIENQPTGIKDSEKSKIFDNFPDLDNLLNTLGDLLGRKKKIGGEFWSKFHNKIFGSTKRKKIYEMQIIIRKIVDVVENYIKAVEEVEKSLDNIQNLYVSLRERLANLKKSTNRLLYVAFNDFYTKELPEKIKVYERKAKEFESLREEVYNLLKIDERFADTIFLLGLFDWDNPKTKVLLNKLCSSLKNSDCILIAKYIFEMKEIDKDTAIGLVQKYPQFALWLRDDLAIQLIDELYDIFSKYLEVADLYLSMVGIVSKKVLKWLGLQVSSSKLKVNDVVNLILKRERPFDVKIFHKVKSVKDFMNVLMKLGVTIH